MKSYINNLLWGVVNLGIGIYNLLNHGAPLVIALSFSISVMTFCFWFQDFPRTYVEAKPKKEEDLYK